MGSIKVVKASDMLINIKLASVIRRQSFSVSVRRHSLYRAPLSRLQVICMPYGYKRLSSIRKLMIKSWTYPNWVTKMWSVPTLVAWILSPSRINTSDTRWIRHSLQSIRDTTIEFLLLKAVSHVTSELNVLNISDCSLHFRYFLQWVTINTPCGCGLEYYSPSSRRRGPKRNPVPGSTTGPPCRWGT
jgi:hypothetical protein